MRLVELASEGSGSAEIADDLPAFAVDDFDLRVVLSRHSLPVEP